MTKIVGRISRRINIDVGYFMKSFASISFSTVVVMCSGLAINIILTRSLSQSDFGYYKQFFLMTSMVGTFMFSGISTNLTIALVRGRLETFFQAIKLKSVAFCILSIVLIGYSLLMYENNKQFYFLMALLGPILLLNHIFLLYKNIYISKKEFLIPSKIGSFIEIIKIILFLLVAYMAPGYISFIIAFIAPVLIINFSVFIYLIRSFKKRGGVDKGFVKSSFDLSLLNGFGVGSGYVDKVVVLALFDPAVFAVYAIADAIPVMYGAFFKNIASIYFPRFAEGDGVSIASRVANNYYKGILVIFLISIPLILTIPFVVRLFFSEAYELAIIPAQILVAGIAFTLPLRFINNFYNSTKNYKNLYINNIFFLLTRVLLMYFLYGYGLIGLAISTAFAKIVLSMFAIFLFRRSLKGYES